MIWSFPARKEFVSSIYDLSAGSGHAGPGVQLQIPLNSWFLKPPGIYTHYSHSMEYLSHYVHLEIALNSFKIQLMPSC